MITAKVREALRGLRFAVAATARQVSRQSIVATLIAIVILVAVAACLPMPTAIQLRDWATSLGSWASAIGRSNAHACSRDHLGVIHR